MDFRGASQQRDYDKGDERGKEQSFICYRPNNDKRHEGTSTKSGSKQPVLITSASFDAEVKVMYVR